MYIAKNGEYIVGVNENKKQLEKQLQFVRYTSIEETQETYELFGSEYLTSTQVAEKRKEEFESQFIATRLGNYRLIPQGYANAQQAMDVTNTMATALGGLTAQLTALVIFYPTPDFTVAEQCTEEWLVAHQINPEVMTLEEWQAFYLEFCQLYLQKMHKVEVGEDEIL